MCPASFCEAKSQTKSQFKGNANKNFFPGNYKKDIVGLQLSTFMTDNKKHIANFLAKSHYLMHKNVSSLHSS